MVKQRRKVFLIVVQTKILIVTHLSVQLVHYHEPIIGFDDLYFKEQKLKVK
jgi:hypothetical protein